MTFVAGGALKPIGGHILSHSSATRMFLRKGELTDIPTNVIFKASCKPMSLVRSGGIVVDGISLPLSHLGRAEERVAKLVDSPDRPESEASYKLDEGGWADV